MTEEAIIKKQEELNNCTFVKTILMLTVILGHSVIFWSGNWLSTIKPTEVVPSLTYLSKYLGNFHTYGFTLVSGYLYYYGRYERKKYTEFGKFVIGKLKRLIVPFFVVLLLTVIPFDYFLFHNTTKDIFFNNILACAPSHLWFLWMLFDVFVVFYFISNFINNNRVAVGVLTAIGFYSLGIIGVKIIPNIFQVWTACRYIIFFELGFYYRKYGGVKLSKVHPGSWIALYTAIFITFSAISAENLITTILRNLLQLLLNLVGAAMSFCVLQKLSEKISWQSNELFLSLSEKTMVIYLLHQQVIYISIVLLNGHINPYFHAMINFVSALLISTAICALLTRYKAARFLLGFSK